MGLLRVGKWAAAVCLGVGAQAGDAVWGKASGGTYDWTNTANWVSGSVPNGVGWKAFVTNDLSNTLTLQLRQNVTLGALFVGDAVASGNNYGITLNNKSPEAYAMTFDSGSAGSPARLVLGSSGTPTVTLGAALALQSDLLVDVGGADANNRPILKFANNLSLNGHTVVVTNGAPGQIQVTFDTGCAIPDSGTLVNQSCCAVSVNGLNPFPGRLVANGRAAGNNVNTFTFILGGFTNAAELVANGYLTNGSTQAGGTLHAGNGSTTTVNPGQRWTRRQITLNGGSLNELGQAASNNGGSPTNDWQRGLEYVRSDVATVLVNSAYCYIGVNSYSTTTGTYFNVGALQRGAGASLYLNQNGTNTYPNVFVAANAAQYLKGGGGATGSTTLSVFPWIGSALAASQSDPKTFTTADGAGRCRGLADSEYAVALTNGASCNVSVSSLALATNATVNALRFLFVSNDAGANMGSNRTLTVTSGGVLFKDNNRSIGQSGNAHAGTLNFNDAEAVVWVLGSGTNTIGARITGTGGLTKAGSGVLLLSGANSYGGTNHVSGGTLRVGDVGAASNLGSGDVRVHVGAVLDVACANALADSAFVTVDQCGLFSGRILLEAGLSETVKYLRLGGAAMPSGTYGSSASAAANKNDQYFAGTGVLVVTGDATRLTKGTLFGVR